MPTTFSFTEIWLNLKQQLSRPPGQLAVVLLALYVVANVGYGNQLTVELPRLLGLIGGFAAAYLMFEKFKPSRPFPWTNTIITFLLLLVILEPTAVWWKMAILGVVLATAKRYARWKQLPIFNFTVFTMAAGYLLDVTPFWWGVSFAPRLTSLQISWVTFLMVPLGIYFANKYKKLPGVAAMAVVFGLVSFLQTQTFPTFLLIEGTILFFGLIMMMELKTSPTVVKEQLVFGAYVGLILAIGTARFWLYPYETALLSANFGYLVWKWWRMRTLTMKRPAAPVIPSSPAIPA